jgi:acyl-CoA hydrolase
LIPLNGTPVKESHTLKTVLVLPPDTNQHGTIFGGRVMSLIDEVAAIAATRHAKKPVVTASVDYVHFLNPSRVGDILTVEAFVIGTGRTSMEVFARVRSENPLTGTSSTTTTSFLTMVAVNENGKPVPVPPVILETEEEKRLHQLALELREIRKKAKESYSKFLYPDSVSEPVKI